MSSRGLGPSWRKVVDALRDLIPTYDRVNRVISLGQDLRYRRLGINKAIRDSNMIILDAGCGPGTMSITILRLLGRVKQLLLIDPLIQMLHQARSRIGVEGQFVQAVFEYLPFKSSSFDAVVSGFALRDAFELPSALSEMSRILKPRGKMLIVDLGKPDNTLLRSAIGFYWRFLAPLLASAYIGRRGLLYRLLYLTYVRLPINSHLKAIIRGFFGKIELETRMMGGVIILVAER